MESAGELRSERAQLYIKEAVTHDDSESDLGRKDPRHTSKEQLRRRIKLFSHDLLGAGIFLKIA